MPDYKSMYFQLFNVISDAIDALRNADYGTAEQLLIHTQQEAEETYISAKD